MGLARFSDAKAHRACAFKGQRFTSRILFPVSEDSMLWIACTADAAWWAITGLDHVNLCRSVELAGPLRRDLPASSGSFFVHPSKASPSAAIFPSYLGVRTLLTGPLNAPQRRVLVVVDEVQGYRPIIGVAFNQNSSLHSDP